MRSYPISHGYHISKRDRSGLSVSELESLAASSSYTLARTETVADRDSEDATKFRVLLRDAVDIAVGSTARWIERERLEGVICFNGRMDMTRGVTYACEQAGIPFITSERPWFGHGLQLVPNANCLSLVNQTRLNTIYNAKPLNRVQAGLAGALAAQRFLKKNALEWRMYNVDAETASWPLQGEGPRVLILPSSRNEFDGHPDWATEWEEYTVAFDELLARLGIMHSRCVLRCHPNWGEKIGKRDGSSSERHYTRWAQAAGVRCIGSREKTDTYNLMLQADIVIVNGSTAGAEAALLGKRVICVGHALYQGAGIALHVLKRDDLSRLEHLEHADSEDVIRKALRYFYTQARRFPQYVDFVRADSTTECHYYQGADPNRIIEMFKTGSVEPDDPIWSDDAEAEDEIVSLACYRKWDKLASWQEKLPGNLPLAVSRRFGLQWIDSFRSRFPRGDI